MARLREFDDGEAMAQAAAQAIAERLRGAVDARGAATLSLSGGTTPGRTYAVLSDADIDWARVTVTLCDERWVAPDAEESNERLVRETLLRGRAAKARLVGLYTGGDVKAAPFAIEDRLREVPRPIDLGVLGVGEDGHTASIFPGDGAALLAEGRVAAVTRDGPGAVRAGVSMTGGELAAHRYLIVLATGMRKRSIIDTVLGMSGDPEGLPLARVLAAEGAQADIYWAP